MRNRNQIVVSILTQLILWLIAIGFFALAIWLLIFDKTASAATSAGFGTVLLFLTNLDRIESFKGFGLEAKTRDLRDAIAEADSAMERLEEMRAEVKALSDSLVAVDAKLEETKSMAQRAQTVAFMNM